MPGLQRGRLIIACELLVHQPFLVLVYQKGLFVMLQDIVQVHYSYMSVPQLSRGKLSHEYLFKGRNTSAQPTLQRMRIRR